MRITWAIIGDGLWLFGRQAGGVCTTTFMLCRGAFVGEDGRVTCAIRWLARHATTSTAARCARMYAESFLRAPSSDRLTIRLHGHTPLARDLFRVAYGRANIALPKA